MHLKSRALNERPQASIVMGQFSATKTGGIVAGRDRNVIA